MFPVIRGRQAGQRMAAPDVRRQMKDLRDRAGLRRRVHPHAFRHGLAVAARREGIDMYALEKQLGHARLDVTARYLEGIDPLEAVAPFALRQPPMTAVPSIAGRHERR